MRSAAEPADVEAWIAASELKELDAFDGVDGLADAFETLPAAPPLAPLPQAGGLAIAVCSADGQPLHLDDRFTAWFGSAALDADLAREALLSDRSVTAHVQGCDGTSALLVYRPERDPVRWLSKPPSAFARPPRVVVLGACPSRAPDLLVEAARAFGLKPWEARVTAALVAGGSLRAAAAQAGVGYESAREAVAAALRRTGAPRQSALVAVLTRAAYGALPAGASPITLLADAFGLSERQARLALAIAQGATRAQAAQGAGVSAAVAKDELDCAFALLGASSAAELGRIVVEARAAALLAAAGEIAAGPDAGEPVRFLARPDGTIIALSDYGPADGRPVLVLHTSGTTRHLPRSLMRALQAAGRRPIAVDRPGFGLSEVATGSAGSPFLAAARDLLLVTERLGLRTADVLARGGAYAALEAARLAPARFGRIVLLNPDARRAGLRRGLLGAAAEAFQRRPDAIRSLAYGVAQLATPSRVERLLQLCLRGSPPDLAAFRDPVQVRDYQRSVGLFAVGLVEGFAREQTAHATEPAPAGLPDGSAWRVLLGRHDPMHAQDRVERFWRERLPGVQVEHVEEAGRFIHLTHPERVIAALSD